MYIVIEIQLIKNVVKMMIVTVYTIYSSLKYIIIYKQL